MAAADPHDSQVDKWLRSIEPRQELVVRYAMRAHFLAIRSDRTFSDRIEELTTQLKIGETQLAMILADAAEVAKHVEQLIGEQPPKAEIQQRVSGPRSR